MIPDHTSDFTDPGVALSLYTFGSPRVGNGAFAHLYNYAVPQARRKRSRTYKMLMEDVIDMLPLE